ncbi:MAG: tetratricopeptide repeat protein [Verrucomicrobiaceae bacterium]|nr:tetratricopeptide repeat protein [Verrucomicrobiaceae bacterium]
MLRSAAFFVLTAILPALAQDAAKELHPDVLPLPDFDSVPMVEDLDPGRSPDLLPPVNFVPEPLPVVPSVQDIKTRDLGAKVVDSLLSIRVWDEFGGQLAHGVGFYASTQGLVVTDVGMVGPEIASKIDYITLTSPNGLNQKVEGFYIADVQSGVALLQAEVHDTVPLRFHPEADISKPALCYVVAVSEKRGLVLATANIQADAAITALGWLPVKGEESPGAVGSPVLDDQGRVVAIVGMQVPLKTWMNFALDADRAAFEVQRRLPALQPLSALPKSPTIVSIVKSTEFLSAFESLQNRRLESALPKLVKLAQKYPRSAECWALLGLAATYLGGSSEAVNCQRKAVALDPKAGVYWQQLALSKLRDKDILTPKTPEDREALELATRQHPGDRLSWLLLASRYVSDGDLGLAAQALDQVLILSPDNPHAHYLHAYLRGKNRDYDGAEFSIRRALNLNPRSAEAWYYQGLISDKKGDLDTAIKAYQTTTRLKPSHKTAWMNLAHSLKKAGRATEAREAFMEHQKRTAPPGP